MEYRNGEQHPLSSPQDFSAIEQHELQKLLPAQTNSTLALANLDQQVSAFIPTEDNPNNPLLPSTNPFSSDTSNTTASFLQLPLDRNNSWDCDASTFKNIPSTNFLTDAQTTNSLTLEQLSRIESTAVNFWQNLLPDHQPLEVNFQIGDLADGQIAAAQVTKFSSTGVPIGGTIIIDRDAQGAGWFIDATPLDWNEFTPLTSGALQAKPDSAAAHKYDLFTTILHELGHIAGFGHGDTTFAGQYVSLSTDKNHITGETYSHDLMAAGLELGERRRPSALDIALIADAIITGQPQAYSAPLSVTGITNGDFSIANSQDPNFKWQTYGATAIIDGIATLSDTSKQLANLTQKFLIPPNATKLQFTIKNSQLGIRTPGSTPAPNDSFEVALLDAQMNPLAGKVRGLSDTDSLLNLQADGTVYFSNKVQIGGVSTSGSKLANANDRTVTIDLAEIASNTEAMLYFDLLSFSSGTSQVSIDNVKVFTSDRPAPQLQDTNLVTNQAMGINIPAPNGATINEIELATAPQHGTVVRNANGQVIYTPKNDYVGTDSFSYLAFNSDGQASNLATVNITVNNVAPTIQNIVTPSTSKEGQNIQLSATAQDGGSPNNLTYTWNLGDGSNPITGREIAHTFTDNGIYNVTLTVTDKDGGSTQQTTQITVDNVAPIVGITAPVNNINQGVTLNFGVNYNDPGIQDTHTITWNFGDGTNPVTGVTNPSHIFTKSGTNNVTVTVTDNDGASTTESVQINVTNIAPTINTVNIPTNINEGQPVQLIALASDPGNNALIYRWYINGATTPIIGQAIDYTFADNGIYPVKLEVIDTDGGITTQNVNVTVNNVAPTIIEIIKPTIIKEGQAVEFKSTATDPSTNSTLTYSWNFGDNTSPVIGQNATHTFSDNGNYNVILTVTDKDGAFTTQTTTVQVDNVAATITNLTLPQNVVSGTTAQFSATATDVGVKDTLTYSWNFGDNTAATIGQNSAHTFTAAGTYNVVLTVTDNNGAITTQNQSLTVTAPPPTTTSSGIRSGGTVSISGKANLDGNTSSRADDTQIYAAKGVTLNGNVTLPVKRDANGNPLRDQNGKFILIDNEITVAPGATNNSAYSNIKTATQTISIPNYADIKQQDFSLPANTIINTFDVKKTPISNSSDWSKFPPAGTSTKPTVVRIINGDLNLPANINLSNYIIIVENGNINVSKGNPILTNVKLIANAGNINLNSVKATNLSLSASGNISLVGNTQLAGNSIFNSNGNTTINGSTMSNSNASVKVISQGDISVSGNATLQGQLFTKKNVSLTGQTTLIGSIDALFNVSMSGNTKVVAKLEPPFSGGGCNDDDD